MQYNTIQYNAIQHNTAQHNTIQYKTIQYNTIQYKQYNTIDYNISHHITLHCIALHCIVLQYSTFLSTSPYITLRYKSMQNNRTGGGRREPCRPKREASSGTPRADPVGAAPPPALTLTRCRTILTICHQIFANVHRFSGGCCNICVKK